MLDIINFLLRLESCSNKKTLKKNNYSEGAEKEEMINDHKLDYT